MKEDLEGLTRPKPNTKFLGIPIKLSIYNLFRNKKENSFLEGSGIRMANHRYYSASLICRITLKYCKAIWKTKVISRQKLQVIQLLGRRRAHARYNVVAGDQYKIAAVSFPSDSSILSSTIAESSDQTLLKAGKPFDLDVIKAELHSN